MFRVQVTIIRQTFQYMNMTGLVFTVWDPYCISLSNRIHAECWTY